VAKLALEDFPFDQYQRYRITQEIVNMIRLHLDRPRLHVLDVGGFFRTIIGEDILPITEFLPDDDVVAVDMTQGKLPSYVLGSGASLPFADGSFDVITTCDTLEHVPPAARFAFVEELLRVTSRYVILAAPFDDERTRLAEQIIFDYDKIFYGVEQPQLKEHAENGLPDRDEVRGWLDRSGYLYVDFASGYLHHWLPMMLLKHYLFGFQEAIQLHIRVDRYYNLNFYHLDHRTPAYRHVFLVSKAKEDTDLLAQVAQTFQSQPGSPADDGMAFARSLLTLIEWEREWHRERERSKLELLQAEFQAELMRAKQENERLARHVEGLLNGRVMRLLTGIQQIGSAFRGKAKRS
jgi:Methyltransferase domain